MNCLLDLYYNPNAKTCLINNQYSPNHIFLNISLNNNKKYAYLHSKRVNDFRQLSTLKIMQE
jgi:hypothetical protein